MTTLLRTSLLALACTLPLGAQAFDLSAMTDAEREAFRAEVRAYLLDNPEVLMEAIAVLEDRQAQDQAQADSGLIAANADALFDSAADWVGGNPEGDVTIVEFIDYRCGYCRRAHPEVTELIESDGNIRLIVKEFPILGDPSVVSSRFAVAVLQTGGPEAYKIVHNALIALRGEPDEATLRDLAVEAGVDADDIFVQMESPEVGAVIAENHALARRLQINGTPSFVLGDQLLRGYLPLEAMRDLVEDVRADG